MKKIILSISFCVITAASFAQLKNLKLSVGPELAAVTGDLNEAYSFAIGATAQADFKINDKVAITAHTGLVSLKGKEIPGTNLRYKSASFIPVLGGLQYFLTNRAYASGQLGISIATQSNGSSIFTYIPGLGYRVSDNFDVLLKYTGYEDAGGTVGVRVGYVF